jgi:hypothetical protein
MKRQKRFDREVAALALISLPLAAIIIFSIYGAFAYF